MLDLTSAAAVLGVPVSEVASVADSPAGDVIVTVDGCAYVVVPEHAPDGAGATGLMFLSAPVERYTGSFPLYTAPPEDEEVARDGAPLSKDELLELADRVGVAVDKRWGESKLREALADHIDEGS